MGGRAGHTESTCTVSPRDSDLLVGVREPAWRAVTDRPPGTASVASPALLCPPGHPGVLHVRSGSLSEVSAVPRADKPAASPAARGALGLCSGLAVQCCRRLLRPSARSPACPLPAAPAWGLGNCPALRAPVPQISSVFTGLINLGPLFPVFEAGAGLQTPQPGKLQQEPVTVRFRKGRRLNRQ